MRRGSSEAESVKQPGGFWGAQLEPEGEAREGAGLTLGSGVPVGSGRPGLTLRQPSLVTTSLWALLKCCPRLMSTQGGYHRCAKWSSWSWLRRFAACQAVSALPSHCTTPAAEAEGLPEGPAGDSWLPAFLLPGPRGSGKGWAEAS